MRLLFVVSILLFTPTIVAAPAPFGLELTKACDSQLENKETTKVGINRYSNGPMHRVSATDIDFRDLKSITAICNSNDKLVAVIANLEKKFGGATFERLVQMLKGKYRAVSIDSAHVGNQSAEFRSENIIINVNEPHMSRTTELVYMTSRLKEVFNNSQKQQQQRQEKKESSAL